MTILGATDEDVSLGRGLAGRGEKTFKYAKASDLHDAHVTLVAHSSDDWWGEPSKIGGLSADDIAQSLAEKYGAKKAQLSHLYLVSCEAGLWYQGRPPLAKEVADALVARGFEANVAVHAIASPRDHDIQAGQSVTVSSHTTGRTTIDAKTYASKRLRRLDDKDSHQQLTAAEIRLWKEGGNSFGNTIIDPLDQDTYRLYCNLPFNTFTASTDTPRVSELQGRVLFELAKIKKDLPLLHSGKPQREADAKELLQGLEQNIYALHFDEATKEKLIALVQSCVSACEAKGTSWRTPKQKPVITPLKTILEQLGQAKIREKGWLEKMTGHETDLEKYQKIEQECAKLIADISTLNNGLPQMVVRTQNKIQGRKQFVRDEAGAEKNLSFINEQKVALVAAKERVLTTQVQSIADDCADELAGLTRQLGAHQRPESAVMQALGTLSQRVSQFEATATNRGDAEELQKAIHDFKQQFAEAFYQVLQEKGTVLNGEIARLAPESMNVAAPQNLLRTKVRANVNVLEKKYDSADTELIVNAEKRVRALEEIRDALKSKEYTDVIAVAKACEKRSSGCFGFFFQKSAEKARRIRAAVSTIKPEERAHVLRYSKVREAIRFHRNFLHCGETASFKDLSRKYNDDLVVSEVKMQR